MFHDETVGRTVRRAVDYWSRHRFQCGNWWWNEIGIPERMANILIAAPELFHDSEERRNALAVVRQTAFGKTGQNRVWQAEIVLKRALLEQDEPTARHAVAEITSELQIRNGEGIQEDGSAERGFAAVTKQAGTMAALFSFKINLFDVLEHRIGNTTQCNGKGI